MTIMKYAMDVADLVNEMGDYDAEVKEVVKNNGVLQTGIMMRNGNVSPVIYLDDWFADGLQVDEAARKVIEALAASAREFDGFVESIRDFEAVKGKILPRLVSRKNDVIEYPHKEWNDLYIIYAVKVDKNASAKVTNQIFESWGITLDELDSVAKANIEPVYMSIAEMLGPMGCMVEETPLMVATNKEKVYGAAAILSPKLIDSFTQDMYIIPSSVHEVITLPADDDMAMTLGQMIREVNATQVSPMEYLADDPYYFDFQTKEIRKAVA